MHKQICFSCKHYKYLKSHPSGYKHFCAASTSSPPSGKSIFPLECSEHTDPAYRPKQRNLASVEMQDPVEDQDVELTFRKVFAPEGGECGYEITSVKTPMGSCWFNADIEVVGEPWNPTEVVFRITYNPEGGKDVG